MRYDCQDGSYAEKNYAVQMLFYCVPDEFLNYFPCWARLLPGFRKVREYFIVLARAIFARYNIIAS
jgi:hypothetical protein